MIYASVTARFSVRDLRFLEVPHWKYEKCSTANAQVYRTNLWRNVVHSLSYCIPHFLHHTDRSSRITNCSTMFFGRSSSRAFLVLVCVSFLFGSIRRLSCFRARWNSLIILYLTMFQRDISINTYLPKWIQEMTARSKLSWNNTRVTGWNCSGQVGQTHVGRPSDTTQTELWLHWWNLQGPSVSDTYTSYTRTC